MDMDAVEHKHSDLFNKYQKLCQVERRNRQVYVVSIGAPVSFSSIYDSNHLSYRLDQEGFKHCWSAQQSKLGQWIQVYQEQPKLWTGVIMQGRGDLDQWVKEIQVSYTSNGQEWCLIDEGKLFKACNDQNSKMRIMFSQPVIARTIRIYPQSWHNAISLRFDALYIDFE